MSAFRRGSKNRQIVVIYTTSSPRRGKAPRKKRSCKRGLSMFGRSLQYGKKEWEGHPPTAPNLQHLVKVNNDTAFVAVRRRRVHCNNIIANLTASQCRPIAKLVAVCALAVGQCNFSSFRGMCYFATQVRTRVGVSEFEQGGQNTGREVRIRAGWSG